MGVSMFTPIECQQNDEMSRYGYLESVNMARGDSGLTGMPKVGKVRGSGRRLGRPSDRSDQEAGLTLP